MPILDFIRDNLATLLVVGSPIILGLVALLFDRLSRAQQDQLLAATKGAYAVIAAVAPQTAFSWDDAVAKVLLQVQAEMGRRLKPREKARVAGIAAALLADPAHPDIVLDAQRTKALLRRARGE